MNFYVAFCEILSKLHTFYYKKLRGLTIGKGTVVFYKTIITSATNRISIGANCLIGRTSYRYHVGMPFHTRILNDGENSSITIGDGCRINGAYIHANDFVTIGDNCVIASGVSIVDSNGHQIGSFNRTLQHDKAKGITIGNNVWIGMNASILRGSHIGDNCVIGAGCVISGVIPDNSMVKQSDNIIVQINMDKN